MPNWSNTKTNTYGTVPYSSNNPRLGVGLKSQDLVRIRVNNNALSDFGNEI